MRKFLQRLWVVAINVAVLAGLVALVEFSVRAIQARKLGPHAYEPSTFMDRWTAWRNAPGYEGLAVRHNRQGFRRDGDVAAIKPPNTVRVFFLGGSAAYGCEGLFKDLDPDWRRPDNRELIDAHLQRILQARHPERRWEVINAAVNEFRVHQHLAMLNSKLFVYKPDLLIFMDGHNEMSGFMWGRTEPYNPYDETGHEAEFQNMVAPRSARALFAINSAWLRNHSVAYSILQRRAQAAMFESAFGPPEDRVMPIPNPVQMSDLSQARQEDARKAMGRVGWYTEIVERINAAAAHEGIATLHTLQPELIASKKPLTPAEARFAQHYRDISGRYSMYMWENLRPEISRRLSESAAKKGYGFVDLGDVFDGTSEKTFTDYCHLTGRGNELIAERIYRAMEGELIPKLLGKGAH